MSFCAASILYNIIWKYLRNDTYRVDSYRAKNRAFDYASVLIFTCIHLNCNLSGFRWHILYIHIIIALSPSLEYRTRTCTTPVCLSHTLAKKSQAANTFHREATLYLEVVKSRRVMALNFRHAVTPRRTLISAYQFGLREHWERPFPHPFLNFCSRPCGKWSWPPEHLFNFIVRKWFICHELLNITYYWILLNTS